MVSRPRPLVLPTTLIALVAAERLAELRLARQHADQARAAGAVETGQGHYPVMVALHTSLLLATAVESWRGLRSGGRRRPSPRTRAAMLGVTVAAQGLRWWCIRSLGTAWNTRVLVVPGSTLSVRGPYQWLKHPNYVAVVAEGVAFPLACGAPLTALGFSLLNAPLLRTRLRAENEALLRFALRPGQPEA